jgi:hypothetical protein
LHHGFEIIIEEVTVDFSMDIEKVVELLNTVSSTQKQLSDGEYLFVDLKLIIASSCATGAEGNELSYFYCSNDISHLINN